MYKLEFSLTSTGTVMVKEGAELHPLKEQDREIISFVFGKIVDEYPEAFEALERLYSKSKVNNVFFEYKVSDRFIRCNMSTDDLLSFDVESGVLNLEFVHCPLRGICPNENVICCPKHFAYSGLTEIERKTLISFIRLRSQTEVGELLGVSENTVKGCLRRIMEKKGVAKIQELVDLYIKV